MTEDSTTNAATPRSQPTGDARRVLAVVSRALSPSSYIGQITCALRDLGWEIAVASRGRPAIDGAQWLEVDGRGRSAARELHALASGVDVVLAEPDSMPFVDRAHTRPPVVLLVDEELLGPRARRLHSARIDRAIALTDAAAAPLRWRGIETTVVTPPFDAPPAPTGVTPAPVIGCATRFDDGAGIDVLLDAFAELRRPDLWLELVDIDGHRDHKVVDAARARAARPDLDGRVRFIEHPGDTRALMARWRVAVAANVAADGYAAPLRDAVALGVPVVATDRGANAEVVGCAGVVVRPGRADMLAHALEQVLDDAGARDRAAERAANAPPSARNELVRVLEEVAERGRRRRAGTIVFVVPDFEPTLGGTTRQTQNQTRELRRRGYDVVILTQRLHAHWPRTERRDGVRLRRVGPSGRSTLRMKLLVLSVSRWLRRNRDDIAVVNALMYPDFVVSAALAGLGSRTVMCWAGLGDATDTVGTSGFLRAPLRAIRRRSLSRAAQVALTPALHDELDRLGLGRDVTIIPTPVDVDAFRPPTDDERLAARVALGVRDDELVIAYTGHLRALKRVELLVDAFGRLVASGRPARLLLVGSSRHDLVDRPIALQQELERLEERHRVVITGAVADVRPYLHAADAFVLPSDREGLSNSVLEALACGLPVVAPPSAAGDQVLDETSGIVPQSNDPAELLAALIRLADDPDYRGRLAVGARRAAERFALARVVNEYESLYSRLRQRAAVQ